MLIVLSPSKTLDTDHYQPLKPTQPVFLDQAEKIVGQIQRLTQKELAQWMKISPKLALLNWDRFRKWHTPFTNKNSKAAIFTYQGEAYSGLDAKSFTQQDTEFSQNHLRILSGLYGVLKPLDLIQPYRLEISATIPAQTPVSLVPFWKDLISAEIGRAFQSNSQSETALINLASNEYSRAIIYSKLNVQIITPIFKEKKGDTYKMVGTYAKKARGMMSRYIIKKRLKKPESIKDFNSANYYYNEKLSNETEWVFVRDLQ